MSQHADETITTNVFNDIVTELSGWEERIERQFKGVAGKALASLQSPFVEDVGEKLKSNSIQYSYLESINEQIERAETKLAALKGEITLLENGRGV